jgi:hypothetical protein
MSIVLGIDLQGIKKLDAAQILKSIHKQVSDLTAARDSARAVSDNYSRAYVNKKRTVRSFSVT